MLLRTVLRSSFGKVNPLKITGHSIEEGIAVHSETSGFNYNIKSPLETLLGSLVSCQISTLKALTRGKNFQLKNVKFFKAESGLDLAKFMKGGPEDHVEDINVQIEVQTTGNQKDLEEWVPKVENSCPVYQMLTASGVKIKTKWTNVNTLS